MNYIYYGFMFLLPQASKGPKTTLQRHLKPMQITEKDET